MYVSEALGCGAEAEEMAARYWQGEVNYRTWGRETVALWKGTREDVIRDIVAEIPYRNGVETFLSKLQCAGVKVAVLSVAFQQHVFPRAEKLSLDYVQCNQLHAESGCLTGEYTYTVDERNKRDIVRSLQGRYGLNAHQTLVAGDSEGDISMFTVSTCTIAVDPESNQVLESARGRLPEDDWNNAIELIKSEWPGWLQDSYGLDQ